MIGFGLVSVLSANVAENVRVFVVSDHPKVGEE